MLLAWSPRVPRGTLPFLLSAGGFLYVEKRKEAGNKLQVTLRVAGADRRDHMAAWVSKIDSERIRVENQA
jgi:hypothetical protein